MSNWNVSTILALKDKSTTVQFSEHENDTYLIYFLRLHEALIGKDPASGN